VLSGQHAHCRERMAGLNAANLLQEAPSLGDFVKLWVDYEFDLYATRAGRQYLTLMLRLASEREVDVDVRRTLNCSELIVINGFRRANPGLPEHALQDAWRMSSAALYASLTAQEHTDGTALLRRDDPRSNTVAFLVGGLDARWLYRPVRAAVDVAGARPH
jgi:hypothetical protein